ncbi:exosortase family protein XrtF [Dokdonia pacifica]|uniref:Exosortase family protein XrtF n=1 Tax=Dokdonia pacifica TaxID=1627892 RepID=A0A239DKB0_9FLAO|nr:exosortase family protein XrtF [Dokdonia pacifica]SNS32133.1 exosortase family protein XrtF [Dokdonia pacifica]
MYFWEINLNNLFKLIIKYKSVLRFILTFIGSYFVLVLLYNLYLTYGASKIYYPDIITHTVAKQSESIINSLGYDMKVVPSKVEPAMNLTINNKVLARVIEGCNAVSVMLLFTSFMLAFFDGWKRTLLFILGGIALIYAMNVTRIALLTVGIYEYPEYTELLHGTIFPAVIYGTVFLLWLGWIRSYKKQPKS